MADIINVGERIRWTVQGRLDNGTRAKLPAPPTWSVAPALLTLNPAADGMTCAARADAPGDCVLTVTSGPLHLDLPVSVLPGLATQLVVNSEVLP